MQTGIITTAPKLLFQSLLGGNSDSSSPVELLPVGKGPCGVLADPRFLCHTPKLHADGLLEKQDQPEAENNELKRGPGLLTRSQGGTPPTSHPGGPSGPLQPNSPGLSASRPGSSASHASSSRPAQGVCQGLPSPGPAGTQTWRLPVPGAFSQPGPDHDEGQEGPPKHLGPASHCAGGN